MIQIRHYIDRFQLFYLKYGLDNLDNIKHMVISILPPNVITFYIY